MMDTVEARSSEAEQVLRGIRRTLRRRKGLMILCGLPILALVIVYNELTARVYEATSSMIFDEVQSPVEAQVDPRVRDVPMFNRLEELGSYSFSLEVARALTSAELARFPWPDELVDELEREIFLANAIHEHMKTYRLGESNVIRLQVRAPDAEIAALVANRAVHVFQERRQNVEAEGTGGIRRFLEDQLETWRARLEASEEALLDYKQRHEITSLDTQTTEMLRRASDAERLHNEARSKREALERRLSTVVAKLDEQRGELVPLVTEVGSSWTQRLQEKLVELQLQYMDLKVQNYPPEHPKMRALAKEIEDTKESLVKQAEEIASGQEVVDPIDQIAQYSLEAASLQIEIQSLTAQEEALEKIVSKYTAALQNLPEKEFQLARLERERDANASTYSLIRDKFAQVRLEEAANLPSMRVIDRAHVPTKPVKPRKKLNLALGVVLGALVGFGVAFVRESSTRVVESVHEVVQATGWRVLASIPRIDRVSSKNATRQLGVERGNGRETRALQRRLVSALEPQSGPAEAFRLLRTQLGFLGFGGDVRTLLVTSTRAADGKSTVAANLAIGAASSGGRTLLVDAETRRPKLHLVFGCQREPGLTDLLEWQEGDARSVVQSTRIQNLDLLASGAHIATAHDSFAPTFANVKTRLEEARYSYEFVIVDTPPILLAHDTALLSSVVDGVILVINSKHFDTEMLQSAKELLHNAGARVLGVVLNDVESLAPYRYEYYSVQA
ncbi:MAG: polysaccharide biosynthesis tyrosine autokinase [Candidatus Latescibacterota bacterium]|nr:MAG: polysaccharide biosynthesis tyrosine autokinase [Candidatus Latescibacterota bacterium]